MLVVWGGEVRVLVVRVGGSSAGGVGGGSSAGGVGWGVKCWGCGGVEC